MHIIGLESLWLKNKEILTKSSKIIRDYGLISFLGRVARKIIRGIFYNNSATWYCRHLDYPHEIIGKRPSNCSVDFNRIDEILTWLQDHNNIYGFMYVPKELELIHSGEHLIATARKESEIIGYIKIARKKVYISDYETVISLPDNTAVIYDTFILPEYRGQGIAPYMVFKVMDTLRNGHYKTLWCHIPDWNMASIKVYSKAGFQRVEYVRFVRLLGLKFFSNNVIEMLNSKI